MSTKKPEKPAKPAASTRTVDRALTLLTTLLETANGSTLTELARLTGLSPSTALRLLSTLEKHQLIRRDTTGRYRTGGRIKQIAAITLHDEPLYELVKPHLDFLANESGETASLGIPIGEDQVLYLRQVLSERQVHTADWTGRTIPRKDTAMGAVLDGQVGAAGYRVSIRPHSDVTAVAVPVIDQSGTVVAAMSINAPSYRTTEKDVEKYGALLLQRGKVVSSILGAPAYPIGKLRSGQS